MDRIDVVVLGSGAAGLTAAIAAHEGGARVALFEKSDHVGGTTAWSGGMIWIPDNHHERGLGIADSREEALTYLMSLSHGLIERHMAETFLDAGPRMVRFLEDHTPVTFQAVEEFPDYHGEHPGGKPHGGRSLECPLFPFAELGDWAQRVTRSPYYPDPRIAMSETPLGKAHPQPIDPDEWERRAIRDERGCGQALIGRLLKACLDRSIEPRTGCQARELLIENGEIIGVRIETPDGARDVAARSVILATGGFERNPDFVRTFLRGPMTHPVSVETNTGDGLRMAMKAGAMLGNMREAWWTAVAEVPTEECATGVTMIMGQRTLPRSIMINGKGRRFVNEAANYNAFGAAFHEQDVAAFTYANLPCWLIFDQGYVERFGFGLLGGTPGVAPPQWVQRAPTIEALADRLGIPFEGLNTTVERWNAQAAAGRDDDFQRGQAAHDTWWGDPTRKGHPDATLGPLDQGPFFAVEIKSGALGTKGGPRVDVNANVIDLDGQTIPGLYAAGNVMASPMGMTYGGAGGTIAPAMVFGFLAGQHAARTRLP